MDSPLEDSCAARRSVLHVYGGVRIRLSALKIRSTGSPRRHGALVPARWVPDTLSYPELRALAFAGGIVGAAIWYAPW